MDPIIILLSLGLLLNLSIELDNLAFIMPIFIEVQKVGVNTSFLSVVNKNNVGESIIEKLTVPFGD